MSWFSSCSNCGGVFNGGNYPSCSIVGSRNEFVHDPLPFDNTPDFSYQPPQHHGNEELNTIPKKELEEFIKFGVEDLIPIPSESKDTYGGDSECILLLCDDFSPNDIPEKKTMTLSNPFFNSNDDFTFSDDESLSDEDVPEDNVKIYLIPLFEFDDEYISSDVNPLFDEVLENIECKDSYDSNLDETNLLVTPLSDANKDECFDSGGNDDDINVLDSEDCYYDSEGDILYLESFLNDDLVHHDSSIPVMSVVSILEGFIDEPPFEENDDLFDLKSKNDDWKNILYDAPIFIAEDKVFDPRIYVKKFSPTYVSLPFTDRHYLYFTYVVRILLLYITYPVVSPFLISSRRLPPDLEVSRARGFHRPLELQSFAYGNPIS
uniref:Reverse transcriptase domain-containing protein n=1 Tax=Tanacetum cinerariifolium TaxID=118510 RepID=A0A6L2J1L0_TANCI|nr:hypothetical protein [Tanacetum cinerariifolium]